MHRTAKINDLWCKGSSFGNQKIVKICGTHEQNSQICHKYHNHKIV